MRPTPLPQSDLKVRLLAIGIALVVIVVLFAYTGGWLTPRAVTPGQFTDRFEQLNGKHPGFRRNHAKGVCFSGWFDSNGQGAELSKTSLFQSGRTPVVGRFSLPGGMPDVADAGQPVRGMALLFKLPDGEEWRTAMVNLPVFPASTPEAFFDLLLASAPDPATGKPDPAKMGPFLAKNPQTAKALQVIGSHPTPSGFENSTFNSLNAFRFINANGATSLVRWSLVPVQSSEPITVPETGDKNFLFDELITNIHSHPLQWHLIITVAQAGDPTDDATIAWPSDRRQIDVGTVTVDKVESDDISPVRNITFDPLVLPDGMSASDDPLLSARSAVYMRSFTRREGEPEVPSAVSPAETGN